MGTSMTLSMMAMMAPTAAPFFYAYGRDTRQPAAVAITVLLYGAVWAAIGALVDLAMSQVMMPSSAMVGIAALAFAAAWTLSPWSRKARARCREMSLRAPRAAGLFGAVRDGSAYAACCVVCSAGIMLALIVLGMSNIWLIAAAAVALLAYKVSDLSALVPIPLRRSL